MGFKCGIVGLPNVGKSTIFNALTSTAQAQSANYPFCTIEPNKATVAVPEPRLATLAKIEGSEKLVPSQIEVIDIAGLVRGASKGEGLGNQFLSHIRQVNAIIHVVRCFEDDNIIHVENFVNPIRDIEIINTELLLADLAQLDKFVKGNEKKLKDTKEFNMACYLLGEANKGTMLATLKFTTEDQEIVNRFNLITTKPVIYVCNVSDIEKKNAAMEEFKNFANQNNISLVQICAAVEADMLSFSPEERELLLQEIGIPTTALSQLVVAGYQALGLLTFFTIGPKEARAWSVFKGATAPNAAGVIHTDFERGFIKAETISYDDFVELGGLAQAKEAGKLRTEGKDYIVHEGDIFHFRFNV